MGTRSEYDFKVIGRNLKKFRELKNLTVENVREYMQIGTVHAIYKWERGESLPQADSLIALLELYGINNIQLLVEESAELSSFLY